VTILTATSGDTGAAVAHAFYGLPNVKVVILYPRGKISPLQENCSVPSAATLKPWRLTAISTPARRW
jgi:threonine synthase